MFPQVVAAALLLVSFPPPEDIWQRSFSKLKAYWCSSLCFSPLSRVSVVFRGCAPPSSPLHPCTETAEDARELRGLFIPHTSVTEARVLVWWQLKARLRHGSVYRRRGLSDEVKLCYVENLQDRSGVFMSTNQMTTQNWRYFYFTMTSLNQNV